MSSLLIKTANPAELKLIRELLNRMKIKSMEIDSDQKEDFIFGQMLKTEKTGKSVSRDTIMKKLKSK